MTDSRQHPQPRRKGTTGRVILFTTIWSTLVTIFGLLAVAPMLIDELRQGGAEQLGTALTASSGVTLAVTAGTALATVLSVWVMHRFFGEPALLDLGLRTRPGWVRDSLIGLALGPLMFFAILIVLLGTGWATVTRGEIGPSGLAVAFATFVLVAVSEELFSRGWVLQVVERGYGPRVATVVSAGVFAVLHAFNPGFGLTALLGLFLAGLLFAQAYLVTRQLWLPITFHLSWNFSEGPIFGFRVSGLPGEGLLAVTPTGPEVITGGPFGPEAGLIVVVGMALASAVLASIGRRRARHADEQRATAPGLPPSPGGAG